MKMQTNITTPDGVAKTDAVSGARCAIPASKHMPSRAAGRRGMSARVERFFASISEDLPAGLETK